MTVQDFITQLSALKPELKNKEIRLEAPNGIMMFPEIKFARKSKYNISLSAENIEYVAITV